MNRLVTYISVLALYILHCANHCQAQDFALKTNLLSDAATNITLGGEVGLAPHWTAELDGSFNAWSFSHDRRWKHWKAMPEIRYWLCDRFSGHFFGFHLLGGQYSIGNLDAGFKLLGTDYRKLADNRYEGWYAGAGIAYGYAWAFAKHWNLEPEIGIGWAYTRYNRYECIDCGKKLQSNHPHNYVGLTKLAINLVYVF